MNQLKQWSTLYDIPSKTLVEIVNEHRGQFQQDTSLAYKILEKNSELLHHFLCYLPAPLSKSNSAVQIDFLHPCKETWKYFFTSAEPPSTFFDENFSTFYFNKSGIELYVGPTHREKKKVRIALTSYVRSLARWPEGFNTFVRGLTPILLQEHFFIYSLRVGLLAPVTDTLSEFSSDSAHLRNVVLDYASRDSLAGPFAKIAYHRLDQLWSKRSQPQLEKNLQTLASLFLSKERK